VAIACWTDEEWAALAGIIGVDDPSLAKLDARLARIDEVEAAVTAWTSTRNRLDVAEQLQAAGIEAVPVEDFTDIHADPQVEHRHHFEHLTHAAMGPREYEYDGFRIEGLEVRYERGGPLLGEDNEWVQRDLLGLSDADRAQLEEDGVFK
jgi:crotonobetainyl-CoA:carnitine CoA-transferase CaiB-like acyl-CoA transferase